MNLAQRIYRGRVVQHFEGLLASPYVPPRVVNLLPAALALVFLDLEPARDVLAACYAKRKGGRSGGQRTAAACGMTTLLRSGSGPVGWCCRGAIHRALSRGAQDEGGGRRPGNMGAMNGAPTASLAAEAVGAYGHTPLRAGVNPNPSR